MNAFLGIGLNSSLCYSIQVTEDASLCKHHILKKMLTFQNCLHDFEFINQNNLTVAFEYEMSVLF